MELTNQKEKQEPKFKLGELVIPDTIKREMEIIDYWWSDKTYGCPNGSWVYRLGFRTKKGFINQRQAFRQFEENRLIHKNGTN